MTEKKPAIKEKPYMKQALWFKLSIEWIRKNCRLSEGYVNSKHQNSNNKQIPMTEIQNFKQQIFPPIRQTALSPAVNGLWSDALHLHWTFCSLSIGICDLFVIWYLRFGISFIYRTFWRNWIQNYLNGTPLIYTKSTTCCGYSILDTQKLICHSLMSTKKFISK